MPRNFFKSLTRYNKKSSLSRKKLNIDITKIKVIWIGTIGDRYNKNQGC